MMRRIRAVLLGVGIAYMGVCLLLGLFQRRLIYFPPKLTPAQVGQEGRANGLLPWTNALGTRIGWWRPAPGPRSGPDEGVVLITHGNAGSAAGREYLFGRIQAVRRLGVVVLEYPGYADRPGEPSQEAFLRAADELMDGIGRKWPGLPRYLVGESLGTGVASYLAGTRSSEVAGVILLAPYNSLTAASASHYPWVPVSWILRDRYPSEEWLKGYHGPLVVTVGEFDQKVPARLGRELFDAYPGRKRLWSFPTNHTGAFKRPEDWWQSAWDFLLETPPVPSIGR